MPVSCVLTVLPGCAVQKSCDVFGSGSSGLCLPLRVLSQPHPLPTFTDGRTWHSLRGLAGLGQRPGPLSGNHKVPAVFAQSVCSEAFEGSRTGFTQNCQRAFSAASGLGVGSDPESAGLPRAASV